MPKRRKVKRVRKVKNNKQTNKTGINININSNNRRKTQPQVNKSSSSRGYNPFPVAHPYYLPQVTHYRDTNENNINARIQKQIAEFTKDKVTNPAGDWTAQQGKGTFETPIKKPINLGDEEDELLRNRIRQINVRTALDRARERQLEGLMEDQRRMRVEEHFKQRHEHQHQDTESSDDDRIILG